jgi:hypothetical protein
MLARSPDTAESLWGSLGPRISFSLARASGHAPFALIELLTGTWIAIRFAQALLGVRAIARRRRTASDALRSAGLAVLHDAGIGVVLFHVLWGFGYARPPLERRLGWSESGTAVARPQDPSDVRRLAEASIDAANAAYRALHGSEDAGVPTAEVDRGRIDAAVEAGWRHVAVALRLPPPAARPHGPVKRLVASPLLRLAGLSGFYAPFTGEANVNASVPAVSYPQTVAHEKAHQRGVNREDEANFLGWLAATSAPDPLARYSAAVFAQRQLLHALIPTDPDTVRRLVALRHPGVQRDIDDLRAYWEPSEGRTGDLARRVNDAYLRGNRVAEGVASYGRSVELLLVWAARHGGVLPGVAPEEARGSDSRTSRTLRASASSVKGFWMNAASDTETPWRTIPSSL